MKWWELNFEDSIKMCNVADKMNDKMQNITVIIVGPNIKVGCPRVGS